MIELHDIHRSFDRLEVLRGVSLAVADGEITTIVGPSGAGKSTLLHIMGTLDRPDKGSVLYDGTDVSTLRGSSLARFRNSNIGFVFQFHQLLPEFNLQENVAMPALIGGARRSDAMNRARELAEMMGLGDRLSHLPAQLSGGERQRAAVARALINRPKVILADEPSGSLDTRNRQELHDLFFSLRDSLGQTFVIVTHDESLASRSDRTIHMVDGLLREPAPTT
ncbi:MAG: ABC transporter ATP-binding protein [Muribaculaceae bacterium]|nr:ABC transporter ATP-binding protein [Muribaculaceae bacterium]